MVDPQHVDRMCLIVDLVDDAILATSSGPEARQLTVEWVADASWVLDQGADKELDDCCGDGFGEPSQRSLG